MRCDLEDDFIHGHISTHAILLSGMKRDSEWSAKRILRDDAVFKNDRGVEMGRHIFVGLNRNKIWDIFAGGLNI